jgi:hypothetical protein
MRQLRLRFTIGSLMIAIAVVAVLLALGNVWGVIAVVFSIPCLALIGSQWLFFRGHRRAAGIVFWGLAIFINALYLVSSITPDVYVAGPLFLAWFVITVPMIAGPGVAWARLATREGAVPRRAGPAAGLSVFGLAMLPLLTLGTFWPLHVAFAISRPSLERLADQVAAGKAVGFPRQAGLFRVRGAAVNPATGNVGLMIDPNPSGPTGFVRDGPAAYQPGAGGPIIGSDLLIELGSGWSYREED